MKRTPRRQTLLRHLLGWVLGALIVVWAGFVFFGLRTGEHEADELTDGHLASTASLLMALRDIRFIAARDASAPSANLMSHDYQQSLSAFVWDAQGRLLSRVGDAPEPPFADTEGFETLSLGQPATQWRTFAKWDAQDANRRRVMILLSVEERDDLAWDIAYQVAQPGFWMLPVVALALGLAIRRGLRPLDSLSHDIASLNIHAGMPLETDQTHEEFRDVVESINQLIARYGAAVTRERELAGELAHEMRTPLASVALHAQALAGKMSDADRQQAEQQLARDALRAGQVLQHLLTLARANHVELSEVRVAFDAVPVASRVLAEHAQQAVERRLELALIGSPSLSVTGHELLLELALRNLVENALAHAPADTAVKVQVNAAERWLQVTNETCEEPRPPEDNAGASRLGLGLGHRVVEKVVALHGAVFQEVPAEGTVRCYRITFAASA